MRAIIDCWKLAACVLFGLALSCTPEEEIISTQGDISLRFSQDTVSFDTLFSTRQSITQYLQVYNPDDRAVQTSLQLAGGSDSPYTIFVNGKEGQNFDDLLLRGGDSLLILVEAQIDARDEDSPFIIEDSLIFYTNGNRQAVKLLSWGQDAFFIDSWHIQQTELLSSDRPYVIRDSIWVDENASLQIPEGVRLYFESEASLWVDGSLLVQASVEKPALFTYVRQDGSYANGPGQWRGIQMSEKSHNHSIDYATIRNAETGIYIAQADEDTIPDLRISNTVIENMSINGILALNADIDAYNLRVSHCIGNAVGSFGKGYYRYTHCTFTNDALQFARQRATVLFVDSLQADPGLSQTFHLELQNSIIWGNSPNELRFLLAESASEVAIHHNLIRAEAADFPFATDNILNEDPLFQDPVIYDYMLEATSPAIGQGEITFVQEDIEGHARDRQPDLGAYEYIEEVE